MPKLPISFPTDLERARRQVEDEEHLTPDQRVDLVCEMLEFAKTLNPNQDIFGSDDPIWCRHEADWQGRMTDVFRKRTARGQ